MRRLAMIVLVWLVALATPALAGPRHAPLQPDGRMIPARCHWLLPPPDAKSDTPLLASWLGLSSCIAQARLEALAPTLTDDDASIAAVGAATRPSFVYLDHVERQGDARWQLLAATARGDLYVAMIVRMRRTIRDRGFVDRGGVAVPRAQLAHAALELQLSSWRGRAAAAFARAADVLDRNPRLRLREGDLVLAGAIRHAERMNALYAR